jgi:hypothetical protein
MEKDAAIIAQQHIIDSMNTEIARNKVIDSMNEVSRAQYSLPQVINPNVVTAAAAAPTVQYVSRSSTRSYASRAPRRVYRTTRVVHQPATVVYQEAPRRRGWSAKAKGAVIGTGAGAIVGAVVNKRNRAAGALIGGILGAGAGTGIGAVIDRRNGR